MIALVLHPGVKAVGTSTHRASGLSALLDSRRVVEAQGACALPGVSIRYDSFVTEMWRAVHRGFVTHEHASFVSEGLRHGFRCGVDVTLMAGHRWFSNYPSTQPYAAQSQCFDAISKRVAAYKTLDLGLWSNALGNDIKGAFGASAIFPMGCVPKIHEPEVMRCTDDHTRTGLNAVTSLEGLLHSLNAVNEIAWFLKQGYYMHVSDVDGAFTVLPFHPDLWPFMFFRFRSPDSVGPPHLFCHLTGDFGTRGMPGVFKIFFVDVLMNMARSAMVLTLPCPVFVDDLSLIGPVGELVVDEMNGFQHWAGNVCGVYFKALKDRVAAQCQTSLGFVWNSVSLVRSLEEKKLLSYVELLTEYAGKPKLTLKEMQSMAGRMQRAAYTMPPGAACLISGLFLLMAGLKLPWHNKRTTKAVRSDFRWFRDMLQANLGRGFYSFDLFGWASEVRTDACKSKDMAGGGFVSRCGRYDWWYYGTRAKRQLIDFLEGDTVSVCMQKMGCYWYRCRAPIGIDNMTFEKSVEKGRSKAVRLQVLVKEVFACQLQYQFVACPFWLSSEDNELADHLSRAREDVFLKRAYETGFWSSPVVPQRLIGAGSTRTLPEKRGELSSMLDPRMGLYLPPPPSLGDASLLNGLPREDRLLAHCIMGGVGKPPLALDGGAPHRMPHDVSVSYPRVSLTEGLPEELLELLHDVVDNRFAASSWRSIYSGVAKWQVVADKYGWDQVIKTDDPQRGGKLTAFVLSLVKDTDLVFSSIENYLWGVRSWHELQLQADPIKGVMSWDLFMASVKVLTFVPHEPRVPTPLAVVEKIVAEADRNSFEDVQMVTLILAMLYTFTRVECPCPQSFTGRGSWDPSKHWRGEDFDIGSAAGRRAAFIRFRGIKQDRLEERPQAQGDGDWSTIGEIPGSEMCFVTWLVRLNAFHGPRDPKSPMFVSRDRVRPLLYAAALNGFKELQIRVGVSPDNVTKFHGLRILGYNRSKKAVGEALTVEHGRWMSSAHDRYSRFSMAEVASIPAGIVGIPLLPAVVPVPPAADARQPRPPPRRLQRSSLRLPPSSPVATVASALRTPPALPSTASSAPQPRRPTRPVTPNPAPAAAGSSDGVGVSSLRHVFPDDLTGYVHFFDRPSSRKAPAARHSP